MRPDAVVYVNGACIPRYATRGVPVARPAWRVGSLVLTARALDISDRQSRVTIPLASVRAVGPAPATMIPPPVSMEQALAIEHVEANVPVTTMIAFPAVTVQNFPMQLAAALTGAVNAFVPTVGAGGALRYDPATFEFDVDVVRVRTREGAREIRLDSISSVMPNRRRGAEGRELVEWSIDHSVQGGIGTLNLLSYERVPFLFPLLLALKQSRRGSALGAGERPSEALSELAQQIAAMLYTGGVTTSTIEQALGAASDKVDAAYEELLKMGLADVVKVRKEIALNPAGMRAVDEIMKKQLESPTL